MSQWTFNVYEKKDGSWEALAVSTGVICQGATRDEALNRAVERFRLLFAERNQEYVTVEF